MKRAFPKNLAGAPELGAIPKPQELEDPLKSLLLSNQELTQINDKLTSQQNKSEVNINHLAKQISDGILIINKADGIVYVSPAFLKQIGYSKKLFLNLTPENLYERIHPDDRKMLFANVNKAIELKKKSLLYSFQFKHKKGHYFWRQDNALFKYDKAGNYYGSIIIARDISNIKQEEERLKLFEKVVTHTNDSIMITEAEPFDQPGPKIIYVNEAFTKMTGYTSAEIIGKTPRILQGPKTDKTVLAELSKSIRQWQPYSCTIINYKKNGEPFWINFSLSPAANKKGWFTHWISIERNVTDIKDSEIKLKQSEEQLQQLTVYLQTIREEERKRIGRELHDELGQQLTALKMDIVWIKKQIIVEEPIIQDKLKNITELLDSSNSSLRRILNELRPIILDKHGLLDALVSQGNQFTDTTGIPVDIITEEKEIKVPEKVAICVFRVFQEALTNISHYAEANKVVTLLNVEKEVLVISIRDNGKGFDTQSELPKTRQHFGILGMRERVRAVNGEFELISNIGAGTTINILVPLK